MTSWTSLPLPAAPVGDAVPPAWRRRLAGLLLHAAARLLARPDAPATRVAGPVPRRWHSRRRTRLVVTRGRLWVTVAGDLRDHAVPAGASLDLPAGVTAWIGALDGDGPTEWHRC